MKAAVIGLGRMGLRHVQVVKDLGLELVGAADLSADARADAGLADGILYDDGVAMLDAVRPDCVVVATTAPSHVALVGAAARAGATHILCEKPMATSLAGCDAMIAACEAAGARLAVNHQMRFMEQYTRPKEIVHGEAFGGLSSVHVLAGNFGMSMNGTHYFEMFRYMTDEVPAQVSAWFSSESVPNPRGAAFEDKAGCVRLVTPCGKRYYMDISTDQGHGMLVSYAGPNGRLVVDELAGHMTLDVRKVEHRDLPTTRYGMPWDHSEFDIEPADAVSPTKAVLEALLAGADHPDGAVGRLAVEVLAAAYLSDEEGGRAVDLRTERLDPGRTFPWA